jgi:hypothetical protein
MKTQVSRQHLCRLTNMLGQVIALLLVCYTTSTADYLVLDAEGVQNLVPRTTVISDILEIPPGAVVTLLNDRGEVIRVVGPHKSNVGGTSQMEGPLPHFRIGDIVNALRIFLAVPLNRLIEVRAEMGESTSDPRLLVPEAGNTQCTVMGEPVRLWKLPSPESVQTEFRMKGTRNRVSVDWPAKVESLDWPNKLPLVDSATYLVQVGPMTYSIQIRTIEASLTAGQAALRLGEAGCYRQFALALTQLQPDRVISPPN